jgi:hypothetical protein
MTCSPTLPIPERSTRAARARWMPASDSRHYDPWGRSAAHAPHRPQSGTSSPRCLPWSARTTLTPSKPSWRTIGDSPLGTTRRIRICCAPSSVVGYVGLRAWGEHTARTATISVEARGLRFNPVAMNDAPLASFLPNNSMRSSGKMFASSCATLPGLTRRYGGLRAAPGCPKSSWPDEKTCVRQPGVWLSSGSGSLRRIWPVCWSWTSMPVARQSSLNVRRRSRAKSANWRQGSIASRN